MQNSTVVAVDVAKTIFEVAVSDRPGHVRRRDRPTRAHFQAFYLSYPEATVVMEACGSAHYWGRELMKRATRWCCCQLAKSGLLRGNKTDRSDTKAILEAYRNAEIRPVPVKSIAQQSLTTLHRLRSGWMAQRTARLNAVRGLLREIGIFIPVGSREVVPAVWTQIGDADSEIPSVLRPVFAEACQEIRDIEARVKMVERELEAVSRRSFPP
jgi:transposase